MKYTVRFLIGFTFSWAMVVWPPIHTNTPLFNYYPEDASFFTAEGGNPPEKEPEKNKEKPKTSEGLPDQHRCDPEEALRIPLSY